MNLSEFHEKIVGFIHKKKPSINIESICADTDLISQKVVTSFELIELVLFIEDMCDRELPIGDFSASKINTINSMYNTFYLTVV
jgi:acyl carrier protein